MAVQAISLARQHGLALPPPSRLDFEMASVDSLVQEGLRETARVAAPAGGAGGGAGAGAAAQACRADLVQQRAKLDRLAQQQHALVMSIEAKEQQVICLRMGEQADREANAAQLAAALVELANLQAQQAEVAQQMQRVEEEALRPPASGSSGVGGDGAPRAVRVSILERDGRDPMLKLTPAGGLSACAAGDLAAARALAAAGWQAAHAVDKHGNTALMWAAGSGRLEVVRWLLEEEGVAVRPAC